MTTTKMENGMSFLVIQTISLILLSLIIIGVLLNIATHISTWNRRRKRVRASKKR